MDLNRIILIGRLATDPEKRVTPSGISVTQFRLAVNRPLSSEARQSGQEKQADFIPIVAWRQSAEFAANYLTKGRLVAVEGRLQIREYTTQEGQKRREAEVIAENLKSLDRPKEGGDGGGVSHSGPDEYGSENSGRSYSAPPARKPADSASGGNFASSPDEDMDDPFADN